jgi:hypothetical protein
MEGSEVREALVRAAQVSLQIHTLCAQNPCSPGMRIPLLCLDTITKISSEIEISFDAGTYFTNGVDEALIYNSREQRALRWG